MKKDLKGRLALDSSTMLELVYSTPAGAKLRQALKTSVVEAKTTEIAITELRYILCRKLGPTESESRVEKLLRSGYIEVHETSKLVKDASTYKCKRNISLADCFNMALAQKSFCSALFARRETEITTETEHNPFDVEILYLEDYL